MGILSYIRDMNLKLVKTANVNACRYKKSGEGKAQTPYLYF